MIKRLSKVYPRKLRNYFGQLLKYCGARIDVEHFLGVLFLFSLIIGFVLALLINHFLPVSFILSLIVVFLLVHVVIYFWYVLKADAKARFVEEVLPDALHLMASNLRAGLTTDKALLLAARPEFGPLKDEINFAGKEIALGKDITEVLINMSKRIRSEILSKTILLISSGLKSGGELTSLLDQTAENLRKQQFVNRKTRGSILMYVIFIFSAISFGAPILFGLSSFLVKIMGSSLAAIDIPQATQIPITFSVISLPDSFLLTFIVLSLVVTSIFGSLVLGLISKGKEKYGIKYIPILIILTLGIFFLVRFLIGTLMGDLFGI